MADVNVNWGALAPMDESINPIKPSTYLNITVANTRTETTRFGVGGSTQSLLQGLKILSIS